jgi:nitroreductase
MHAHLSRRVVVASRTASSLTRSYSLAEAFEIVCLNRVAVRNFSAEEVPGHTMRKVLELAQTAPSSFNIQPYKIIVVGSPTMKAAAATAMMPGNNTHVETAAYTIVIAADKGT